MRGDGARRNRLVGERERRASGDHERIRTRLGDFHDKRVVVLVGRIVGVVVQIEVRPVNLKRQRRRRRAADRAEEILAPRRETGCHVVLAFNQRLGELLRLVGDG